MKESRELLSTMQCAKHALFLPNSDVAVFRNVGHQWVPKRATPEKKDLVNGVSCSPPSLTRGTARNHDGPLLTTGSGSLRLEQVSRDLCFSVETMRTPISRLHQLQEPHSHSPRNLVGVVSPQ
jgi:hypothetical protein